MNTDENTPQNPQQSTPAFPAVEVDMSRTPGYAADGPVIGVVGATGQVGRVMLALLADRSVRHSAIRVFASARSAGKTVQYAGLPLTIENAETADITSDGQQVDIAVFRRMAPPPRRWPRASPRRARPWWTTPRPTAVTARCRWWSPR